ncbi:glycosyltransferase [Cesiribacter sp. SM1]|uniref:glycosyltransferase n=1 Tax=Cesiribacter sp. SM1 TaxID=2861196 RepID=UPI001CD2C205|nr:glycosyltransferase [Cesiribacter sp. SM1]
MAEKIKVLHIIKSLGRGGAEMLLPETLNYHNQERYEFHYIYFLPWKDQVVKPLERNGGIVTCMSSNNNLDIMAKVPALVRYIRRNNIKLVHCHLAWAGIAGRIAAKLAGVPVIYTEHNNISSYHILTYLASRMTLFLNDLTIAVSADAREASSKVVSPHKLKLILNGVDTVAFQRGKHPSDIRKKLGIPEDHLIISTVAVFRIQKRLDLFIKVAAGILQRHEKVSFIMIGDGPEKPAVEQQARELGLEGKVFFEGLQHNVKPYFELTDIYLMTSDFEGLPIALLEAMSMSCAPVATDVGGIPEVVENGISGLLSPAGDVEALQQQLELLIEDKEKRLEIASNARYRIENYFSMKKMVRELEEVYQQFLTKGAYSKLTHGVYSKSS